MILHNHTRHQPKQSIGSWGIAIYHFGSRPEDLYKGKIYFFDFLARITQFAKKIATKKFRKFCPFFLPYFLTIFGQIRIFPKNLIRPLFTAYNPLTSCKKSEKSNEPILRKIQKTDFFTVFWLFLTVFGHFRPNANFPEKSGSVKFLFHMIP